jgi:hypothetical protein
VKDIGLFFSKTSAVSAGGGFDIRYSSTKTTYYPKVVRQEMGKRTHDYLK